MKYKLRKIILLFVCFLLIGCQKSNDNNIDNKVEEAKKPRNLKEYVELNNPKTIICPALNESSISFQNYFSNGDKDIYFVTFDKIYSNNENCRKGFKAKNPIIGSKSQGVYSGLIDSKYYVYQNGSATGDPYIDVYDPSSSFKIEPSGNKIRNISNQSSMFSYSYIANEKLIVYWKDKKYIVPIPNDEKIVENYGDVVKTENGFYELVRIPINKDECEKYEDVACEYKFELQKNDFLTNSYDYVLNFIHTYVVTKDYHIIPFNEVSINKY